MKKNILLYLLAGWWSTLAAQTPLSGSVVDGRAGNPLPGVTVNINDKIQTRTDEHGRFGCLHSGNS